jgi:hypothetical protein
MACIFYLSFLNSFQRLLEQPSPGYGPVAALLNIRFTFHAGNFNKSLLVHVRRLLWRRFSCYDCHNFRRHSLMRLNGREQLERKGGGKYAES